MAAQLFRTRPDQRVAAVQLRWDTWSEMCEHAVVGKLTDGCPEGCYLDAKGEPTFGSTDRIGLLIPASDGLVIAREGDWVVKGAKGELYSCKPEIFAAIYVPVQPCDVKEPIGGRIESSWAEPQRSDR